jgi:hypothetical protein
MYSTTINTNVLHIGLDRTVVFQKVEGPIISRQSARESGKVISRTHRLPLPPGDNSGSHFC